MSEGFNSVNWNELISQAEENSELPDGSYVTQIHKVTEATSKNGKHQLKVQFKVATGPNKGYMLFDTLTLSPENDRAVMIFIGNVKKLAGEEGITALKNKNFARVQELAEGRYVEIKKGTREYPEGSGVTYDDVQSYKDVSTEVLNTLMQESVNSQAGVSNGPTPPPVQSAAPPPPPPS